MVAGGIFAGKLGESLTMRADPLKLESTCRNQVFPELASPDLERLLPQPLLPELLAPEHPAPK
jgi:hypothetical protein